MMDFDTAVELLLSDRVEGGYSNNRFDPGGETMWGITRKTAAMHGYVGDMHLLPKAKAAEIYRKVYWDPLHIDDMPEQLRYPLFDGAVNEGVVKMAEFLNQCLNLSEDSIIDGATSVAAGVANPWTLTMELLAKRVRHYTSLPTFGQFGRGWSNRVATNLEILSNLEGHA